MSNRPRREFHSSIHGNHYTNDILRVVECLDLKQVNQPGTYWYHSHNGGQYPDGFRGPILIHDPASPYAGQYEEELVLTLSDWYHKQMPDLIPGFLSPTENPTGAGESALYIPGNEECLLLATQNRFLTRQSSMTTRRHHLPSHPARPTWSGSSTCPTSPHSSSHLTNMR